MELQDIPKIFQGFKNLLFKDEKIESIAEERLKRCFNCDKREKLTCSLCGCYLKAKVRSSSSSCPIDKW
jgi:hypothetical protein